MTKILPVFILLSIFLSSCSNEPSNSENRKIVEQYMAAYNNFDLDKAASFIGDNIEISEFEFIQTTDKESWLTQSQWDLVFLPKYNIVDVETVGGKVEATISKTCKRIEFLHDTAIVSKTRFEFKDGAISKIHVYEYVKFDFDKWEPRRDSLVAWVAANHPELNGFIYDQTQHGAEDYLKAIAFYGEK